MQPTDEQKINNSVSNSDKKYISYIKLFVLLFIITSLVNAISIYRQINLINRADPFMGLGLAGVAFLIGNALIYLICISIVVGISLYFYSRKRLNLLIIAPFIVLFSLFLAIGQGYFLLQRLPTDIEYNRALEGFNIEAINLNDEIIEVNKVMVIHDSFRNNYRPVRYEYHYSVDIANNTQATIPIKIQPNIGIPSEEYPEFLEGFFIVGREDENDLPSIPIQTGMNHISDSVSFSFYSSVQDQDFLRNPQIDLYIYNAEYPIVYGSAGNVVKEFRFETGIDNWIEMFRGQVAFENDYDNNKYSNKYQNLEFQDGFDWPNNSIYLEHTKEYSRPEGFDINIPQKSKIVDTSDTSFQFQYALNQYLKTTITFTIIEKGGFENSYQAVKNYVPVDSISRQTRIVNRFRGYEYYFNEDKSDLTYIVVISGNAVKISHFIENTEQGPIDSDMLDLSLNYIKYLLSFVREEEYIMPTTIPTPESVKLQYAPYN